MTQNTTKEIREKIIARDQRFAHNLNIILGIALGTLAGLIISASTKTPIQFEHLGISDTRVYPMLFPIVLAMENGFSEIGNAVFGDLIGLFFAVFFILITKGIDTAFQTSIMSLEVLVVVILLSIIIATIMKIGALILKSVLERIEPTLNKAGEHLTNKINKINGNP